MSSIANPSASTKIAGCFTDLCFSTRRTHSFNPRGSQFRPAGGRAARAQRRTSRRREDVGARGKGNGSKPAATPHARVTHSRRQAHLLKKSDETRLARKRCEPGIHVDLAQVDGADLERAFEAAESSVPVAQPHLDERDPKRRDVLGVSAFFELSKDHPRFVGPPRSCKRVTKRAVGADRPESGNRLRKPTSSYVDAREMVSCKEIVLIELEGTLQSRDAFVSASGKEQRDTKRRARTQVERIEPHGDGSRLHVRFLAPGVFEELAVPQCT